MPWVRQRYNVTSDPARTVVGGFSLGGLTATFLGLRHSTIFGNVLAQSGSFWWAQDQKADDAVDATHESNWIAKQFSTTPKLPIRFYLDAGTFEAPKAPDIVRILVNARHLRDVLAARRENQSVGCDSSLAMLVKELIQARHFRLTSPLDNLPPGRSSSTGCVEETVSASGGECAYHRVSRDVVALSSKHCNGRASREVNRLRRSAQGALHRMTRNSAEGRCCMVGFL
jgi:hypothetical protein